MNIKETKRSIIQAGHKAVEELIKVAKEAIVTDSEDDLTADKLKNAAAFFSLSAVRSSSESVTIASFATLINSSTALCPAWIILLFVSLTFIFDCNKIR